MLIVGANQVEYRGGNDEDVEEETECCKTNEDADGDFIDVEVVEKSIADEEGSGLQHEG